MAQQKHPNGFPAYARNQFAFDGLLCHQPDRLAGPAFGRAAAHHCNQTLFLALIEHFRRSGSLFLIQSTLQAALLISLRLSTPLGPF